MLMYITKLVFNTELPALKFPTLQEKRNLRHVLRAKEITLRDDRVGH